MSEERPPSIVTVRRSSEVSPRRKNRPALSRASEAGPSIFDEPWAGGRPSGDGEAERGESMLVMPVSFPWRWTHCEKCGGTTAR